MRLAEFTFSDNIRVKRVYDNYLMKYKEIALNEEEALLKAFNRYNSYIDFRLKNPAEYLCICRNCMGDMSILIDIKRHLYARTNKSRLDGEWLSLFEIESYLENGWIVYIVKDKEKG